jgi:hypothetical protein
MLFSSDREPRAIEAGDDDPAPDRHTCLTMAVTGPCFVAAGLLLQWYLSTATLVCGPRAPEGAACVVHHHMLLGLVPTGTEPLSGVTSARYEVWKHIRKNRSSTFRVILQTAGGEYRLASTRGLEAAHGLAGTITQRLKAGAAFEASLGFAFYDWALRTAGLLGMAAGAGLAARGLHGLRRAAAAGRARS